MNNRENDEMEIDLKEICCLLLDRIGIICLSAVILAAAGFIVSRFVMTPQYVSETQIYVLSRQNENNVTYSDLQMGSQLINDYAVLIKSRTVLEEVVRELNLEMSAGALGNKISVNPLTDTRILSITVTDPNPETARSIADAVQAAAAVHIKEVMDIEAVNVVAAASLPTAPSSPSVRRYTLMGGVIGIVLSAGIIVVRFLLDDTIKTPDNVERYLGMSTLASIPMAEEEGKKKKGRRRIHRGHGR